MLCGPTRPLASHKALQGPCPAAGRDAPAVPRQNNFVCHQPFCAAIPQRHSWFQITSLGTWPHSAAHQGNVVLCACPQQPHLSASPAAPPLRDRSVAAPGCRPGRGARRMAAFKLKQRWLQQFRDQQDEGQPLLRSSSSIRGGEGSTQQLAPGGDSANKPTPPQRPEQQSAKTSTSHAADRAQPGGEPGHEPATVKRRNSSQAARPARCARPPC